MLMPMGGKDKHACNLRIPKVSKKQVSIEYDPLCDSAETQTHPNCLQSLVFTGWTFFEDGKHVKIQVNQCFLLLFKVTYLVSIKIIMQQKSARIELPITSWSKKEKGVEMQKQLIWLCEVKWRVDWNQLDKNGNSFKFEKQRFWSSFLKITMPRWDESPQMLETPVQTAKLRKIIHSRRHSGSAIQKSQGWMLFWLDNDQQNARSPIKAHSIAELFCICVMALWQRYGQLFQGARKGCFFVGQWSLRSQMRPIVASMFRKCRHICLCGRNIASYFKKTLEGNAIHLDNDEPNVWCHHARFVVEKIFLVTFFSFGTIWPEKP